MFGWVRLTGFCLVLCMVASGCGGDENSDEEAEIESVPTTVEACMTKGSEDCGPCIMTRGTDGPCGLDAQSGDVTELYFSPEEIPYSANPDEMFQDSCSDGGDRLAAYRAGWANRGCTLE